MPDVLNRHDFPGRLPPNTILCDRTTGLGNPFMIGKHGDRDTVCDRYEAEVLPTISQNALNFLRGKNLMCWCAPLRCHCDALLKRANEG